MKNKILLEITEFCKGCNSNCCCPEDECILFRIEEILVDSTDKIKNVNNLNTNINDEKNINNKKYKN